MNKFFRYASLLIFSLIILYFAVIGFSYVYNIGLFMAVCIILIIIFASLSMYLVFKEED